MNDEATRTQDPRAARAAKNRKTALAAAGGVVAMVGLSFASVPLYDLFCRVTGFGGTTQVGAGSSEVIDREVTVRFDASVNKDLPWSFRPKQAPMTVKVGESHLAFYKAESLADHETLGTATFNVTPIKAGQYFVKIDCFCFTEQMLTPGQSIDMPVTFYVDPAIEEDPDLDDVNTITLSYTFFPKKGEASEQVSSLDAAAGTQ
ncbi:MAG: cytochrome c oxidase assembly protein [Marivibrio sp.]|uniref:cytochrome c oxidase assembly protein n=1 Tax=Marivibrio sp. TaxID=2039719 RepID=UPI0032EADF8A